MAAEIIIPMEELRLRTSELAVQVQTCQVLFGIRTGRGKPRYQLAPISLVHPERVRSCVQITADRFRRKSAEIRALVRVDDVPFGILVRRELQAIFQRHPSYTPTDMEQYRAEFNARQAKAGQDVGDLSRALENRITAVEANSSLVEQRLSRLELAVATHAAIIRRLEGGSLVKAKYPEHRPSDDPAT
jgi:hypothetical protein